MADTTTPTGGHVPPPPPPPPPPPHPVYVKPQGRGCAFWLGWVFAFLFFSAAALFFFTTIILSVGEFGGLGLYTKKTVLSGALTEKTVEGSGSEKVLLLPLHGVIGERESDSMFYSPEASVQYIHQRLQAARSDSAIKGILLDVDSPGGGITASDIIYDEIRRFKKETGCTVVVSMGDVAASGGYYVSAPADCIFAHPTTITGSIGVIMTTFDASLLMQKIGVQDNPIKSGVYKDIGSWSRPMTPEERQMLETIIKEMLDRFVTIVADGRKLPKDKVKELADGRIFTATQAKAAKLVDEIGYYEDALKKIKQLAKLPEKVKVIRYDKSFSFSSLFDSEVGTLIPGRGLNAALRDIAFPRGPRLMYLWTGR